MHSEGGFGSELGFDCLGLAQEVVLNQFIDVVLVFCEQNSLAVAVVRRPAGSAAHLFDLENRNGRETEVHVEAVEVSHDYTTCREIDARRVVDGKGERAHIALVALDVEVVDLPSIRYPSNSPDR